METQTFGLTEDELLNKYNTTSIPIQGLESFRIDVDAIANRSTNRTDFEKALQQLSALRYGELQQAFKETGMLIVAQPKYLPSTSSTAYAKVTRLCSSLSLAVLIEYLATEIPPTQSKTSSPGLALLEPTLSNPDLPMYSPSSNKEQLRSKRHSRAQGPFKGSRINKRATPDPRRSARIKKCATPDPRRSARLAEKGPQALRQRRGSDQDPPGYRKGREPKGSRIHKGRQRDY